MNDRSNENKNEIDNINANNMVNGKSESTNLKSSTPKYADPKKIFLEDSYLSNRISFKIAIISSIIIFVILGIILRISLLKYQGFFEPDGFFHYSVIREAITQNNLAIPEYNNLSGFPTHNKITEPEGLYYVTIVPWLILNVFGISYYTTMRIIPILFGILDILLTYVLTRKVFRDSRLIPLIASAFVAFSAGDISRTEALVYRGDGFITSFLLVGLILLVDAFYIYKNNSWLRKKALVRLAISYLVIGVGFGFWNGAPYMYFVILLSVIILSIYYFLVDNTDMLRFVLFAAILIIEIYAIQHLLMLVNFIRAQQALSSPRFFIFYIPVVLLPALLYYALKNRDKSIFKHIKIELLYGRVKLLASIVILGVIIITILFSKYLLTIASGDGLVIANNGLTESIEELQKPDFSFIYDSFGLEILLMPLGLVAPLLLYIYYRRYNGNKMLPELFTEGYFVILAYLIITLYLQLNAIRFNSIVAVPIAILAALAVESIYVIYLIIGERASSILRYSNKFILLLVIAVLIYQLYFTDYIVYAEAFQADNINTYTLQAMSWIRNNTALNATFLAVWPDGSVIEGFGERQSLMDSVSGQNGLYIEQFAQELLSNNSDNLSFILEHKPDYIYARYYWLDELAGIAQEANLGSSDAAKRGIQSVPLNQYGSIYYESYSSNNSVYYFLDPILFENINKTLITNMTPILQLSKVNQSFNGYIKISYYAVNGNSISLLSSNVYRSSFTELYNINNATFSFVRYKNITGYGFLVIYSNSSNGPIMDAAYLLGPYAPETFYYELLFECNNQYCPLDNSSVRFNLVYDNVDSKIYRLTYS
ncbi:MAG: hypothetical protein ARM1_0043 [Candidatus Micrarchaeota archaeon]|nr:MAG: hypothetical protein ARM1_0043 [Candidatus Micrarchaeota archaeon]